MRPRAVHQFHPTLTYGDAISNDCWELQRLLWSAGMRAEAFAFDVKEEVRAFALDAGQLDRHADPDAVLLLHHSMGHDRVAEAAHAPFAHKATVFHNITPAQFFAGISESNQRYAELGREQLPELARVSELGIAVSEFNRKEMELAGFARTAVVPILIDWSAYDVPPDPAVARNLTDERTNVVVVGQVLPHKDVHGVIGAFDRYRTIDRTARLFVVGSTSMSGDYLTQLRDDVRRRGIADRVTFTGRVDMRALVAYYRGASVVLTLSDHEGFCVPLLEAMRFGKPIVAHAAAAIPETLGEAGILLADKSAEAVATALEQAVHDDERRTALVRRGTRRLEDFSRERIGERLRAAFALAGWELPAPRWRGIAVVSSDERDGIKPYALAVADGLRADRHDVSFIGVKRLDAGDLRKKLRYIPHGTDLVIVEHEAGLFQELPFLTELLRLRLRGIPTVLSMHELEPDKFHNFRMLIRAVHYRPTYSLPLEVLRVPWVAALIASRFLKYRTLLALTGALPARIALHSHRSNYWVDLLTRDRSRVDIFPLMARPLGSTVMPRDETEKRRLREKLGLPQDKFIFVSPGFFFRRKRFLDVIVATPDDALLVLSGTAPAWDTEYFDEVMRYVNERKPRNVLINTDFATMDDHFAASDAAVLYYEDIFQSGVATQAIWAGLPCIFSDISGFDIYRGAGLFARDTVGLRHAMEEIREPETYARVRERTAILRHMLSPERLAPRYLAGIP